MRKGRKMKRGRITFLIIPQGQGTVREVKISTVLIRGVICLFIAALAATAYLTSEYVANRKNLALIDELERANQKQADSLRVLMRKVDCFEKRIAQLNDFDRKIRIMSNLEVPEEEEEGLFGVGGSIPDEETPESRISSMESDLIDEIQRDIDQLLEETSERERSFRELVEYLKTQQSILARTPSIWPVVGWVTSEFGYRKSPFTGRREFHNGIDIATRHGKEIVAPADGIVSKAGSNRYIGNYVWIDHGDGIVTIYGHLCDQIMEAGQIVKRGDVIGHVGNSGRSTGPHLHYGVMVDGEYVNPRRYLF